MFHPTFERFRELRYGAVPGDCPWNPCGFQNDFADQKYSEMSAHMPFLEFLARQCQHITEFGTRSANSTAAFLSGTKGKVVSYDIQPSPAIVELLHMKAEGQLPCEWEFHCKSTCDPNVYIEDTDLLFVDTLHTFEQVEAELKIHGDKANRWIVFHDVFSQGLLSLDSYGAEGINRAIKNYIDTMGCWEVVYQVAFNHGLLVIERTGD